MSKEHATSKRPRGRDLLIAYVSGFVLSVLLTLAAFALVTEKLLSGWGLVYAIVGMALLQLAVQMVFFLHLGNEAEPRWKLLMFDFAAIIVIILVVGTMWIMNNLHYNGHTPVHNGEQVEQEIIRDEGINP